MAVRDKELGLLRLLLAYSDKEKALLNLKGAAERCLELCRDSPNTLVCLLLCKNGFLETFLHGDTSESFQRRLEAFLICFKVFLFGDCLAIL